ncbi:hypothetical protein SEA_REDFIELD_52 [Microbacterium phage Redfield]|uniref:Uncharacterized protein n=7 Tax=Ilzatvirus hamlet TaxID=2560591 RepID=A0A345MEM1_9CAUD|nr:hypothetical protein FDJ35_gp52 [Microbacterium phage Hamlet]AUX83202.1 hypothetical protein PBI_PEPPINO_52 [Microbacterium phage Peppino]AUX83265.1 hypothetical protein PBI_RACCOON_52 [Microbacterium phage Raccoon]AUX83577.1 hypothetical protein PBI_BALSA_51 [Microbacterium phage Balsa]AVR56138.1 hypothetical protein PBI_BEEBEE8_53 [Microbacterium phage BeeBee8]AXH46442.1 hypothetical protein SEA_REDFIELD_52 [Microbacterium phage Redfield]AXH69002.1 hypothetical protein SCHNAPSIDEE_52 [Mi
MDEKYSISFTEALAAQMLCHDRIDETNAIGRLRHAQAVLRLEYDFSRNDLNAQRSIDEIDDVLIMISENGRRDIFFE